MFVVVNAVVVVDIAAEYSAALGFLAMPREVGYNDGTEDSMPVLAIRRLVDSVNAGGASRSRQEWPVNVPQ